MPAKAFSIEDGNLNTSSISTTKSVVYTDLDLFFSPKPSGDVYKKQDVAAVKQSVKNILMTNFMEKPFNPEYNNINVTVNFQVLNSVEPVSLELSLTRLR